MIKGIVGFSRIFYALLAVGIIFLAAYILGGREFLQGSWGTDMTSALSMAAWVDKYFPHVPFWYPLAGGGVSITHSYPMFSFILAAFIKRIFDLNIVQSFTILAAMSVPLMAVGIYAFVSLRLKSQTAALIASIFYLVSPVAWVWLTDWGFYAETVSHIFIMPTILFWDLFFTGFLVDPTRTKNRIYLVLTVIFLALAFLTHFGTGFSLMAFFGFYILGYVVKEKERKRIFVRGIVAIFLVGILALALTAFTAFPFYRYSKIASQSGLGKGLNYEQMKEGDLPLRYILSIKPAVTKGGFPMAFRHISFPAIVSLLAVLGIILSFQKARTLTLALFTVYALTFSISIPVLYWVMKYVPWPLGTSVGWRFTFMELRGVLPIMAALGVIGIFRIPLFWLKGKFSFVKEAFASLAGLVFAMFLLYQFGYLPKPEGYPLNYGARGIDIRNIWNSSNLLRLPDSTKPKGYIDIDIVGNNCAAEYSCRYTSNSECIKKLEESGDIKWCHSSLEHYFVPLAVKGWCEWLAGTGNDNKLCYPDKLSVEQVKSYWEYCRNIKNFENPCGVIFDPFWEQIMPSHWPRPKIVSDINISDWLKENMEKIVAENPRARLDFSPYSSGLAMQAPLSNLNRDLSQLYIYTVSSASLNSLYYGQQLAAFYIKDPFYGSEPDYINNLTRWFGLNYIFLEASSDIDLFQKAGWEYWNVNRNEEGKVASGILKFPEENSLVELSDKPSVLVIGQDKVGAYAQVYQLVHYGTLPYKDYFIVRGEGVVDNYDLKELKKFDVILLYGYTYKNQRRTDELLKNYVTGGGKLFIDTGWQYTAKDWETQDKEKSLEVIPLEKLSWKDLGKTGDFVLEDSEIGKEVEVSKFSPLVYGDQAWGVSTAEKSDLKDWAKTVLSVKGYPLVVIGNLGEGKVVWSGINFFSHAKQGASIYYDEIKLMNNLFSWLTEGVSRESTSVSYQRINPDKLEFKIEKAFTGGFLLWKEAYHPDFHAQLVMNKQQVAPLKTYRAGPSLTLIAVPELKGGETIVFQYKTPLSEKITTLLSLLTIFFLPLMVLEGSALKERSLFSRLVKFLEEKLDFLLFKLWRKPFSWWRKDEGEY